MQIALPIVLDSCNNATSDVTGSANVTSPLLDDVTTKGYDHVGAMEFIVATLLVYCLLGIAGLILLRVRRRASRSQRTVTLREEHIQEYIKQADELRLSGYRDKLRMEARRMMTHIETIERRKSETSSVVQNGCRGECSVLFTYSYEMVSSREQARLQIETEQPRFSPSETTVLVESEEADVTDSAFIACSMAKRDSPVVAHLGDEQGLDSFNSADDDLANQTGVYQVERGADNVGFGLKAGAHMLSIQNDSNNNRSEGVHTFSQPKRVNFVTREQT